MDFSPERNLRGFAFRTSKGVQNLSEFLIQKLRIAPQSGVWKYKESLKGVFLVTLATIFGCWANSASEKDAILRWERTYRPSEKVVAFTLGSLGMTAPKDPRILQKAIRSLPSSLDEEGSIWITPEMNWIAYYSDPEKHPHPQIFCFDCIAPPLNRWQPLGYGWRALDRAIDSLSKRAASRPKQIPALESRPQKAPFRDPRALVY